MIWRFNWSLRYIRARAPPRHYWSKASKLLAAAQMRLGLRKNKLWVSSHQRVVALGNQALGVTRRLGSGGRHATYCDKLPEDRYRIGNTLLAAERHGQNGCGSTSWAGTLSQGIIGRVFLSGFRRLGKKTQVHPCPATTIHNRLTHSLEQSAAGGRSRYALGGNARANY